MTLLTRRAPPAVAAAVASGSPLDPLVTKWRSSASTELALCGATAHPDPPSLDTACAIIAAAVVPPRDACRQDHPVPTAPGTDLDPNGLRRSLRLATATALGGAGLLRPVLARRRWRRRPHGRRTSRRRFPVSSAGSSCFWPKRVRRSTYPHPYHR